MNNGHGSEWTVCFGEREGLIIPVGVKIFLDPPWVILVIDLVDDDGNVVRLVAGILRGFRPEFLSLAHFSEL